MRAGRTRRSILAQAAAAGIVATVMRPMRGVAAEGASRLVFVRLRGALDGLAAVPAYGDPAYCGARGGLALRAPGRPSGILDLDGFFGLHPALARLHDFYARKQMLVLPAAATSYPEQLHGPGRAFLDIGRPANGAPRQGWVDRAEALLAEGDGRSASVWRGPREAQVPVNDDAALIADLCHEHAGLTRLLASHGGIAQAAAAQASGFCQGAKGLGMVLSGGSGPRLAVLESHGWDTHADQGTHDGRLAVALAGLADGLVALAEASGDAWRHTVVLVATEFGRSVHMNTMGGTDHGSASAAFLLGGAVAGGWIVGRWPGLAPDRLHRGRHLAPTIDLHAVIKAVLVEHLGLARSSVEHIVLPGAAGLPYQAGLFRA